MGTETLGSQIKSLRIAKRMTQKTMAETLSLASSTISNWENGWRQPSVSELQRIAELFGVSLRHFDLGEMDKAMEAKLMSEDVQLIEHRPIHGASNRLEHGLFGGTLGLLIMHWLFEGLLGELVYGLALILALAYSTIFILRRHIFTRVNDRRTLVPVSHAVRYVHPLKTEHISSLRFKLAVMLITSLVFTAFYHGLFGILVSQTLRPPTVMLLALYGLVAISASYYRYRSLRHGPVFFKTVDYHNTLKDLRHHTPTICLFIQLGAFGFLGILHRAFGAVGSDPEMIMPLLFFLSADLILDYLIMEKTRRFVRGFKLEAEDAEGMRRVLF